MRNNMNPWREWLIAALLCGVSGFVFADSADKSDVEASPVAPLTRHQQREALIAKCLSNPMLNPIRCEQDAIILFGRDGADGSVANGVDK